MGSFNMHTMDLGYNKQPSMHQLNLCTVVHISLKLIPSRNAATVVGILWLSCPALELLKFFMVEFHAFVLAPWGIFRTNLNKYGEWTGEPILKYQ